MCIKFTKLLRDSCDSSKVILRDSLEMNEIDRCPNLKRLPLSVPLLNGRLSPPLLLNVAFYKDHISN